MIYWREPLSFQTSYTPSARLSPMIWSVPVLFNVPFQFNVNMYLFLNMRLIVVRTLTCLFPPQDSHFPPVGRMMMPRPSMCHTSSLQIPNDKDQALRIPVQTYFTTVHLPFYFSLPTNSVFDHLYYRHLVVTFLVTDTTRIQNDRK